jgi:hypothetical protein
MTDSGMLFFYDSYYVNLYRRKARTYRIVVVKSRTTSDVASDEYTRHYHCWLVFFFLAALRVGHYENVLLKEKARYEYIPVLPKIDRE